ncbi:MAG: hypothetical protein L6V93_05210 [Clostridiales bacterium]|nr:MAG: hypothetical protein L6V93_05210 [Clostridiales bacterium]
MTQTVRGLEAIMLSALMMIKRQNIIVYFPLQKNIVPQGYFGGAEKLKRFECDKAMYDVVFLSITLCKCRLVTGKKSGVH